MYEIDLMLNPNEPDHQLFLKQVRAVVNACLPGSGEAAAFPDLHVELAKTSKGVLKREWNRVKAPITIDGATE